MSKENPKSVIDRLEDLSFLDLSNEEINIILGKNTDLKSVLNAAQECSQIRILLRHLILKSFQSQAGVDGTKEEILKWRSEQWEDRVQEAFLDRRRELDQVSFWMVQTNKKGQALELYYQLCNEETTFEKLSLTFRGVKKEVKKPYYELHKILQQQLRGAGTSKPQSPIRIKTGYLVTKVIEQHPAKLDAIMKEKLLSELETDWADRQILLRLEELRHSANTFTPHM